MGKSHQAIAGQMKSELEEPLAAFAGGMKERRKIVQNGIEKLFKIKVQQTQAVNKASDSDPPLKAWSDRLQSRDRYEQDCLKIKGYMAQGHMVMGQEERKNKAKMEKTQIQLASTSNEYEAAVKALEETTGRWNRDWKAACDVSTVHAEIIAPLTARTEVPRSGRRKARFQQKQLVDLRQCCIHGLR